MVDRLFCGIVPVTDMVRLIGLEDRLFDLNAIDWMGLGVSATNIEAGM